MEIKYDLTIEDYINFNLIHIRNSPTTRKQQLILRLFISFLIFIFVFILSTVINNIFSEPYYLGVISGLFAGIIGSVSYFFIFPSVNERGMRKNIRKAINEGKNDNVIGKHKISMSSESITEATIAGEANNFWSSLDKFVESADYLLLYLSALQAIIIPRHTFSSEKQCNDFIELVEGYYLEASNQPLHKVSWK